MAKNTTNTPDSKNTTNTENTTKAKNRSNAGNTKNANSVNRNRRKRRRKKKKSLPEEILLRIRMILEEALYRLEDIFYAFSDADPRIWVGFRVALVLLAVLFVFSAFRTKVIRRNIWLNHTTINEVDVSGKTIDETLDLLPDGTEYSLSIHGREGGEMIMKASDIDYQIRYDEDKMKDMLKKQHKLIVFPWTHYNYRLANKDGYSEEKLTEFLDNCILIKGSEVYEVVEPKAADIVYSKEENKPIVKKETYGNALDPDAFSSAVKAALEEGTREMDLEDEEMYPDIYKKPKVTSDSPEIKKGMELYKGAVNRYLTWDMWEGETYTLTPEKILPLMYYSDGKMKCRTYKLEKLIQKFCDKYQTAGKPRVFTTHKGKKVKVEKGDYGWKLDFNKVLDQAETALAEELDQKAVDQYIANPVKANQEAVTIHLKPQYKSEAFRVDYKKYQDWDPDNYTEASLSEQMVYVHRNGKIEFKCKTISGLPVEGRRTGKGVFYVKGKSPERVLRGEDYETEVKYWVRLTTSGTGFHAAPWQNWKKWSKNWYKKHGSHGCLNLSDKDAKKMYEILKEGEAVFIY